MTDRQFSDIIQRDVLLKDHSTFKIGGPARFFCTCRSKEEIKMALDFAVSEKLRVFIIGRGSNLLISDDGFDGLVLKIDNTHINLRDTKDKYEVTAGAGTYLMKLILDLQNNGISGLEWAAGIPGSLGGTVCNNAGAHGKDISTYIKSVRVFKMIFNLENKHLEGYETQEILAADCGFLYRTSIFKANKTGIIFEVVLLLQKGNKEEIQKEIGENMKNRAEKQPLEYPNIGSIFKNPVLTKEETEKFLKNHPEAESVLKNNTIPAGWLIDRAELTIKKVGNAEISQKHANFIVNTGGAKAKDVAALIELVKVQILAKFGIQLHEEIEYVGF